MKNTGILKHSFYIISLYDEHDKHNNNKNQLQHSMNCILYIFTYHQHLSHNCLTCMLLTPMNHDNNRLCKIYNDDDKCVY